LYIYHFELAHSLTLSNNSILSGGFNEPVAEFMAYKVCENQNLYFDLGCSKKYNIEANWLALLSVI